MLTQKDLVCSRCGGSSHREPVYLKSHCHPRLGVFLFYRRDKGAVQVRCAECDAFVCHLALDARTVSDFEVGLDLLSDEFGTVSQETVLQVRPPCHEQPGKLQLIFDPPSGRLCAFCDSCDEAVDFTFGILG